MSEATGFTNLVCQSRNVMLMVVGAEPVGNISNAQSIKMTAFQTHDDATETLGAHRGYARFVKPTLDKILVLLAAPFLIPLVAVIALMIRRDGGPAFYSQPRVGKDQKLFTCWKLRTMVVDADARLEEYLAANPEAREEWDRDQKLRKDPRITRFGNFLRAASIDELPQLWCVLKGDMSLVGPRPFMVDQKALYPGTDYYTVRPGLTGFWQVGDRNETTFAERAEFDNRYAREVSLATDATLLWKTVGVVLRATGV